MRKWIAILSLIILIPAALSAAAWSDLRLGASWWYTTNAFSDPLPLGYDISGPYPSTGEFIMRHDIGGLAALDIYFDEQFTTGMSAAIAVSYPLTSRSVRPVGTEFDWEYSEYDSTGEQKALLQFGFGPVFRFDAGDVEIILPIRFSVASFDCFSSGVLVGVWIDPAVNVFITDRIFFTGGIQYNAHLMKFLFNESRVYEAGYIKLSVGLFAGIGIRMGG